MPEQPRDPRHYEMKSPPEPEHATLKHKDSERPADDENHESAGNSTKDTSVIRGDDESQSVRGDK